MRRIGIMGGTFNPIHNGHLAIAQGAKEQFALDQVLFMPSGVPYMKNLREVLPAFVRCEMTALAIQGIPYFKLSDIEAASAKNTYTYQTLETLKSRHPDRNYYFILGADSLYAIESWRNPARIFESCTVLAAVRKEAAEKADIQTTSEKGKIDADSKDASLTEQLQAQIQYLRKQYHASVEMLKIPSIDVSSTHIRDLQKRERLYTA